MQQIADLCAGVQLQRDILGNTRTELYSILMRATVALETGLLNTDAMKELLTVVVY